MAVVVTLTGSATDDGHPDPPGALTYAWTKISGPGGVVFADAADPTTTATIDEPGIYVLRLTASDGALFHTDDITITVFSIAPDMGLVTGQQNVVGIGSDGFLYRTTDFQTVSGSGGPTWVQIALGVAAKIYSWVVDPFSPGYIDGVGTVNGWIVNDTDIYRVTDLFGTPSVVSVFTFPVPTVPADFHWRTIQASFGAFFAEGLNPFLVCVSNYGDTLGKSGMWVTHSEDGGVTWAAEVVVSQFYHTDPSVGFLPIAAWTSPRTPGLVYTAAAVQADEALLPLWGIWDDDTGLIMHTAGGTGQSNQITESITGTGSINREKWVVLAPTTDTVRVSLRVTWSNSASKTPGTFANPNATLTWEVPPNVSDGASTSDFNSAGPFPIGGGSETTSGEFDLEYTLVTGEWVVNRTNVLSVGGHPGTTDMLGVKITVSMTGQAGETMTEGISINVRLIELELEDATIITPSEASDGFISTDYGATWAAMAGNPVAPGRSFAGTIHVPFPDNADESLVYHGWFDDATNRQFRVKKVTSGVSADVSPSDGTRSYGIHRGPFGIRTYDGSGGQQYVLASVIGNDTSLDPAADFHAVYISDDNGATWTQVVAPIPNSAAPTGRPAFEAAFAGDTRNVIFIWGPPDYIGYSANFGVTVDNRNGNLDSFGTPEFIGIAGGIS